MIVGVTFDTGPKIKWIVLERNKNFLSLPCKDVLKLSMRLSEYFLWDKHATYLPDGLKMFQDVQNALNLFVTGTWSGKEALCIGCV